MPFLGWFDLVRLYTTSPTLPHSIRKVLSVDAWKVKCYSAAREAKAMGNDLRWIPQGPTVDRDAFRTTLETFRTPRRRTTPQNQRYIIILIIAHVISHCRTSNNNDPRQRIVKLKRWSRNKFNSPSFAVNPLGDSHTLGAGINWQPMNSHHIWRIIEYAFYLAS